MRKYVLIIFVTVLFADSIFAQFEAQFSQYMFNAAAYNPAAVGAGDLIDIRAQHRLNWLGIPMAGQTTTFGASMPVKLFGEKHGVGINFVNDIWGGFKNQTFRLQYAYRYKIANGVLSAGIGLGFASAGFSGDSISKYPITLGDYHDLASDPALPTSAVSSMQFDAAIGAWYQSDKWYAGVSYQHLNNPTIVWDNRYFMTQHGVMYLTGGYTYEMPDNKVTLVPSALFKTDFSAWAMDLSARAEYDGKFWGGVSYRVFDAFVIYLGFNIINGLSVGYSVDISTNKMITQTYGSHELLLMYSFNLDFDKKNNKYKSIRFL
jgi:type IX secretion system PorP/SprF family membrane protein